MSARWQQVVLALSVAALVAAIVYWMGHEPVPRPRSSTPPGDAGVVAIRDAASRDAPSDGPVVLRARATIAASWIDFTVRGDSEDARALCEALVAEELRRVIADVKPILAHPCRPEELPPIPHDGTWLIDTRTVDAGDLVVPAAPTGATATIERISMFTTAAGCEQMRQRLAKLNAASATSAATMAIDFLVKELDQAKRARDRDCKPGAATERECSPGRTKVELIERTLVRQRAKAPPPSAPSVCR
jgi:hypothetical protein